ncbi:MAG: phytoene desaturase family protein [Burkholderiales bacterium]
MSAPIVVIGGGVNALVAAHWLARAGKHVVILDERMGSVSLESGWIPPAIIGELGLSRNGLAVQAPDPWISAPSPDGRRLELWHDVARSADSIRPFSVRDAERWPAFCEQMQQHANLIEVLYTAPPPDVMTHDWRELARVARLALHARRLGRAALENFLRMMPMSVADFLDDWFEADVLKGVLGAGAVMHLHQGPRSGGTAFGLLHHHVGSGLGVFRPTLSNITQVLEKLPGIERRMKAKVKRIDVAASGVTGVTLADGSSIEASCVVSGADPRSTLLEWVDTAWLDPELVRSVRNIRARGVVGRVVLTLDRAPGFSILVIAPSLDYLERAYDDAKYRRVSREPFVEARYEPQAGSGRHVVMAHVQYVPYLLDDGKWDDARARSLAESVIVRMAKHVPGLQATIRDTAVASPIDLEAFEGAPQGQVYHAELALDQLLWMRPLPGLARYRTPINGLYLCGPAMHPGAGIAGASGMLAAQTILRDRSE